jgi:hypothetical protein
MLSKDNTPWESDEHEKLWHKARQYYAIERRWQQLTTKLDNAR